MPADPGYVAPLDGVRALAVATVLVSHYTTLVDAGRFGVLCFFVLSGFLITGILLRARAAVEDGDASIGYVLRQFYARRCLRIVPLYYATLIAARLLHDRDLYGTMGWHLAYLSNVHFALTDSWGRGTTIHLWSLSVEEQFYLVWPLLVLRVRRRWLLPTVCAAIATAPLWRAVTIVAGVGEVARSVLLPGAMDALGLGALLALTWTPNAAAARDAPAAGGHLPPAPRWLAWSFLAAAPVLLAHGALNALPAPVAVGVEALFLTSVAAPFAWLVYAAHRGGVLARVLGWRPLVRLGRISYGVYLLHLFVPILLSKAGRLAGVAYPERGVLRLVIASAATIAIAAASWRWFERPINALKRFFPYPRASRAESAGRRETVARVA